ncbi:MAG TPA: hypothetical protein VHM00_12060 [Caldimonas sp.]|nr:hypothetical protein [Caldimonas sp.]HEX2541802.1 hypothetical protein [Caldimonas sp.]
MRRFVLAGSLMVAGLSLALATSPARAAPIVPASDDEVVEVLPATTTASRSETQRLRKQLAARPGDARLAHAVASRYLAQAHELGDPRFAGLAMAALRAWPDPGAMPSDLLLMKATLQQYLHEFDASLASLRQLLARPDGESHAQAWLTLATVLRVQGRYGESDAACRELERRQRAIYARGCLAENAALRGEVASARQLFETALTDASLAPSTRAWLLTSLAELEQRDGRVAAADAAYRAVLRLGRDSYAAIAYADFLIEQRRPAEALRVLERETRSDAVVLRTAIAETLLQGSGTGRSVAEMRERIALANERPGARVFHGREQAMFALMVERSPELAFELARGNVARQREPLDLLVLAQAARATGRADAMDEARRLKASLGLHDRRIDALL